MKNILCVGQAAFDITLVVDEFPKENKKMRTIDRVECAGGSAFNSAYLLASWGVNTTFVGCIGNDYYGSLIEKEAVNVGIKANFCKTDFTTTSYIIANISIGSRTIMTHKNKLVHVENFDFTNDYDILVLDSNEVDLSLELLKRNLNSISILDAGKYCDEVLKLGKYVTYFVCSKDFAEAFTDLSLKCIEDYKRAYEVIYNYFHTNIIITLESKGSFTKIDGDYKLVPSIMVKPVDSTGAGDIYHGAFAYFISQGTDLVNAMRYANIAGAISTTRIGSKASIPSIDEVMKEAFDEIL